MKVNKAYVSFSLAFSNELLGLYMFHYVFAFMTVAYKDEEIHATLTFNNSGTTTLVLPFCRIASAIEENGNICYSSGYAVSIYIIVG